MDHRVIKLRLLTLRSSSSQSSISQIHLEVETISAFSVKVINGLIQLTPLRFQLTLISELLLLRSLKAQRTMSHGMELSKNILFCKLRIDLQQDHTDGQMLDIQELKVHSIAQQVVTFALEELLLTHILRLAFMLELISQELMLKLCQDNGNFKLVHALEFNLEITCGLLDSYL